MVKATTKKNTKKPTRKSLSVLKIVLLACVSIVASLFVYNQIQLNNEKNSFMQLRSDFLSLQTEFNKIDSGWVYSEGCATPHYVFDAGTPSCEISISKQKLSAIDKSVYISLAERIIGKIDNSANNNTDSRKSLSRPGFDVPGKGYCAIDLPLSGLNLSVNCVSQARSFYFQRTNN